MLSMGGRITLAKSVLGSRETIYLYLKLLEDYFSFEERRVQEIRLSPMLNAPLGVLSCHIICHVISLQIFKNLNFISNPTNIFTLLNFHLITYSLHTIFK
ncbi:hypothetical protein HanLR1_Chr06g0206651 [Helianthus annuus]|nr:hypothetical protein HanLR1_Chr06g0206651 [Helianthus annuus]